MTTRRFFPDFKAWFGSAAPETELPQRVQATIREQQDQSEMMIGWIQFAVVSIMGVLYLVSPKTFAEDAAFAPVPWALGIYLALTLLRLAWASVARLPDWSLILSMVLDVTLLMVLIWSFHLQYDQPPSFYLKAPTLLYVFIFIALRALRFEARCTPTGFNAILLLFDENGNELVRSNVGSTDVMETVVYTSALPGDEYVLCVAAVGYGGSAGPGSELERGLARAHLAGARRRLTRNTACGS